MTKRKLILININRVHYLTENHILRGLKICSSKQWKPSNQHGNYNMTHIIYYKHEKLKEELRDERHDFRKSIIESLNH